MPRKFRFYSISSVSVDLLPSQIYDINILYAVCQFGLHILQKLFLISPYSTLTFVLVFVSQNWFVLATAKISKRTGMILAMSFMN